MLIDCDTCVMRDIACADCVVSMLLGGPAVPELDDDERRAVDVLAEAGLVAPLRLVRLLDTSRGKPPGQQSIAG